MVTPLLTTKTLPLVLKALPPTVAVVTAAITKPDLQSVPINLQVASKLTNQSAEPVRLVTKNAMVVSPAPSPHLSVHSCQVYDLLSGMRLVGFKPR